MSANETQDRTKQAQDGPKMRPRGLQAGARWTQDGSQRPQEEHKLVQDGARRGQNGGQVASQLANMLFIKVSNSFEDLPKN